ncbi:hypothetical protein WJX77_006165 [Trebouxia sp. C0004]
MPSETKGALRLLGLNPIYWNKETPLIAVGSNRQHDHTNQALAWLLEHDDGHHISTIAQRQISRGALKFTQQLSGPTTAQSYRAALTQL